MIQVKVNWFAAYRDATGTDHEAVETGATSPAELFREMSRVHENLRNFSGALVAINDEMCDWEAALKDGDEVLFFPPVAGG
jgi:molybdopterin converting factor small subunit